MGSAVLDAVEVVELWGRMSHEERERARRPMRAQASPLWWMRHATRTMDEQDHANPYKPLPNYEYFDRLYDLWLAEPILFLEKSRTMMQTWFFAGLCTHWVMTHQPAKAIFWAQDEDRALKALEYGRTLYKNTDEDIKAMWPLDRPLDRQAYNGLEWRDGGALLALPGKDPDKIRSEHPTIVMFDEAAFIDKFREALVVALSTRVPKLVAITSANPGSFREATRDAKTARWEARRAA